MRLVKPTSKYKESFIGMVREFQIEERKKDLDTKKLEHNFSSFVKNMSDYEKGKNLPKGHVPSSYYWLLDKSKIIGETTIRHKLSKELIKQGGHIGYGIRPTERRRGYGKKVLTLALKKAKKLGIKKALITCDDSNIGSWKIIEANGGILSEKNKLNGKLKRYYWIRIK